MLISSPAAACDQAGQASGAEVARRLLQQKITNKNKPSPKSASSKRVEAAKKAAKKSASKTVPQAPKRTGAPRRTCKVICFFGA